MRVEELAGYWPYGLTYSGGEWRGSCPFCVDERDDSGDPILTGEDRFHLFNDGMAGHCRHCELAGRGPTGKGWYSAAQIIQRFGHEVPADMTFERSEYVPEEKPLRNLWTQWQVDQAHAAVDYLFWEERYGLNKETVDRFQLGFGTFHSDDPPQHIIPMDNIERFGKPPVSGLYFIATRGTVKKHSSGTTKPYLWMIEDDPADKTIAICEGDTDPLAVWAMGYKNIASTLGATTWMDEKAQLLVDKGYTKFLLLMDADDPGQKLADQIEAGLFKRVSSGIWRLQWD